MLLESVGASEPEEDEIVSEVGALAELNVVEYPVFGSHRDGSFENEVEVFGSAVDRYDLFSRGVLPRVEVDDDFLLELDFEAFEEYLEVFVDEALEEMLDELSETGGVRHF